MAVVGSTPAATNSNPGGAGRSYSVYARANVALPIGQWWLIGTSMASDLGVIDYTDAQTTSTQRFHRFGQLPPFGESVHGWS